VLLILEEEFQLFVELLLVIQPVQVQLIIQLFDRYQVKLKENGAYLNKKNNSNLHAFPVLFNSSRKAFISVSLIELSTA
jgi:hypothetical protein